MAAFPFGFELPLHDPRRRADFGVSVVGASRSAAFFEKGGRCEAADPSTARIARLLGETEREESPLRRIAGRKMLLEYDIDSTRHGTCPDPGIFLYPDQQPLAGDGQWVRELVVRSGNAVRPIRRVPAPAGHPPHQAVARRGPGRAGQGLCLPADDGIACAGRKPDCPSRGSTPWECLNRLQQERHRILRSTEFRPTGSTHARGAADARLLIVIIESAEAEVFECKPVGLSDIVDSRKAEIRRYRQPAPHKTLRPPVGPVGSRIGRRDGRLPALCDEDKILTSVGVLQWS